MEKQTCALLIVCCSERERRTRSSVQTHASRPDGCPMIPFGHSRFHRFVWFWGHIDGGCTSVVVALCVGIGFLTGLNLHRALASDRTAKGSTSAVVSSCVWALDSSQANKHCRDRPAFTAVIKSDLIL